MLYLILAAGNIPVGIKTEKCQVSLFSWSLFSKESI